MSGWLGFDFNQLNFIGTSFLMTSTEKLVAESVAYAIIREGIINDGITSPVCFRPFHPELKYVPGLVQWSKHDCPSRTILECDERMGWK
jgi:hypothetical protein